MKISKIPGLGRFGIFIDDVDLSTITPDEWMAIGKLHMEHLVTIIRNANCTPERQYDLVTQFGEPRYGLKAYLLKKYAPIEWPELFQLAREKNSILSKHDINAINSIVSTQENLGNGKDVNRVAGGYDDDGNPKGLFADGELLWHSNESGTLTWTPGVALLGGKNVVGSATGFLTTVDYYESLSESFRSELNEMILVHKFTPGKINPGLSEEQDALIHLNMCPEDAEVPMVARSPGGHIGLHYSINTTHQIKGISKSESDRVFNEINKGLFVDKYIYDHWYQGDNDLCLFDNSITLHRRLGNIDGRVCYRIAHDYTNLQDGVYQPYFQKPFQLAYNKQIREIVTTYGIKNFKLPPRRLVDSIPLLNRYV